ncbi:MAG TPA: peptidyl-tRNA hydrolase Pth2 [archaeon]|nr:peptidyl-tRNA hydrolase Pth2 [archaeon]
MYKQVIVINSDIKISKGKTAAQAAHASVSSLHKADNKIINRWKDEGQKKVVVKASLDQMIAAQEKCKKLKLPFALIADAGRTEIASGTVTALGIGPEEEEKIDKVTGSMKLLK